MINRLTYDASVTHLDVLRWATQGSARCLGRSDIGEIAVGKQADLALFTLDELRFSGAGDPLAALEASQLLEREGFLVTPIRPPTVPEGTARLRLSVTRAHSASDLVRAAEIIRNICSG